MRKFLAARDSVKEIGREIYLNGRRARKRAEPKTGKSRQRSTGKLWQPAKRLGKGIPPFAVPLQEPANPCLAIMPPVSC
jgi:hypothetical protein